MACFWGFTALRGLALLAFRTGFLGTWALAWAVLALAVLAIAFIGFKGALCFLVFGFFTGFFKIIVHNNLAELVFERKFIRSLGLEGLKIPSNTLTAWQPLQI